MGDLLASSSLLLALIAILYGLWYSEIELVLRLKIPRQKEDRRPNLKRIRSVLFNKTVPLTCISIILSLIFLPDSIRIVIFSFRSIAIDGVAAIKYYNAVAASFIFITSIFIFLSLHMFYKVLKLSSRLRNER